MKLIYVRLKISTVGNKHELIEQLRAEASINCIKLSVVHKDLLRYCQDQDHESEDVLYGSFSHLQIVFIVHLLSMLVVEQVSYQIHQSYCQLKVTACP